MKARTIMACILLIVCAAVWLNANSVFRQANFSASFAALSNWRALIHLGFNQFVMWRSEPLLSWILSQSYRLDAYILCTASYLIFALGTFSLLLFLRKIGGLISAFCYSLSFTWAIALFYGADLVLCGAICWFPFLLLSLLQTLTSTRFIYLRLIQTSISAILFALSANQLALPLALLCVCSALLLRKNQGAPNSSKAELLLAFAIIFPACLVSGSSPSPSFPDYPQAEAHLVPDDGQLGINRPLLGADLPLPSINREELKDRLERPAIFLLSISLLLLFSSIIFKAHAFTRTGIFLNSILAIDLLLPESIAQIGPLFSLSRVIPGTFLFSLSYIVLSLGLFYLFLGLWGTARELWLFLITITVFSYAALTPFIFAKDQSALEQILSRASKDQNSKSTDLIIAGSPSYHLLKELGAWVLFDREVVQNLKTSGLSPGAFQIFASHNSSSEQLAKLSDLNETSRWTPGKAKQEGGEFLKIVWNEAITLRGIELNTGKFKSDFPRGLRISSAQSCSKDASLRGFQSIFSQASFQGVIRYSSLGFPFFGAQADVKIVFPKELSTNCLLIEQTGSSEHFDWSVAVINILK